MCAQRQHYSIDAKPALRDIASCWTRYIYIYMLYYSFIARTSTKTYQEFQHVTTTDTSGNLHMAYQTHWFEVECHRQQILGKTGLNLAQFRADDNRHFAPCCWKSSRLSAAGWLSWQIKASNEIEPSESHADIYPTCERRSWPFHCTLYMAQNSLMALLASALLDFREVAKT